MSVASTEVDQQIETIVASDQVVLFMKGNRQAPQCGFSSQLVQILDRMLPSYTTFDVLLDTEVREGIKSFSDWPTIPQLYIGGEFQGGCDVVREMYEAGELHQALGIERPDPGEIEISVSEEASKILTDAQERYDDQNLHIAIDASFTHSFGFGATNEGDVTVQVGELTIALDRDSATRASGLVIDTESTPTGNKLRINNPNQPEGQKAAETTPEVRSLSAERVKEMLDQGTSLRLIDVRTDEEREMASIEGGEQLTDELGAALAELPKETVLVFHCHHGGRAQNAAEHFASQGFSEVYNLQGGINAWSLEVDPSVPRY